MKLRLVATGLALLAVFGQRGWPARAPEPAPARAAVLALIEQQLHSWETGDEAAFLGTLHPDIVFAYPGKRLDLAGVLEVFHAWKREYRDTRVRVHRIVIDGANFSVEYIFAGTKITADRRAAGGTVAVGEVQGGRLRVWKEYLDGRVSRAQLAGELPVQESAEPFPWPDTLQSRRP